MEILFLYLRALNIVSLSYYFLQFVTISKLLGQNWLISHKDSRSHCRGKKCAGPDQDQPLRSTFTNVHTLNLAKTAAITLKMGCMVPQQLIFYVEIKENGIQNDEFFTECSKWQKITKFQAFWEDIWILHYCVSMSWAPGQFNVGNINIIM